MPPPKRFGKPAPRNFDQEVVSDSDKPSVPGLGWKISEATQRQLEELENNMRLAEQRSGAFRLG